MAYIGCFSAKYTGRKYWHFWYICGIILTETQNYRISFQQPNPRPSNNTMDQTFFQTTFQIICSSIICLVIDSFIEYSTHRWPMHVKIESKWLPLFRFLYWHHITVHHAQFSGDKYHHKGDEGRDTIAFPLWVAPLLIGTAVTPFAAVWYYTGNIIPFWTSFFWAVVYYALFEGIHKIEHMVDRPEVRWIRNMKTFQWLDTHHEIHHRMKGVNFNLVFPLADWLMGTLVSLDEFCEVYRKTPKTHRD